MTTTTNDIIADERNAIEQIRIENPTEGQMTLAKRINNGEYDLRVNTLSARPLLSTYSVIRRYDARNS